MIDKLEVTVPFNGDELYEIIKLYDILRDMDFELSETQVEVFENCLLYTSPSPRDTRSSRMPSSA